MPETPAMSLASMIAWAGNLCAEALSACASGTTDNAKILLGASLREAAAALRDVTPTAVMIDAVRDECETAGRESAEALTERERAADRAALERTAALRRVHLAAM
jgi:hypothetical protein